MVMISLEWIAARTSQLILWPLLLLGLVSGQKTIAVKFIFKREVDTFSLEGVIE